VLPEKETRGRKEVVEVCAWNRTLKRVARVRTTNTGGGFQTGSEVHLRRGGGKQHGRGGGIVSGKKKKFINKAEIFAQLGPMRISSRRSSGPNIKPIKTTNKMCEIRKKGGGGKHNEEVQPAYMMGPR